MAIRFHHRTGAVLTAAAACFLLGGCLRGNAASPDRSLPPGELPPGKLTGEYACSRPEASLRSPGAVEIARSSRDENFTSAARCSVLYASPEDQVPIYKFYTDWAHNNGYHYYTGGRAGSDVSARTFQRPNCREILTVAVQSPRGLRESGLKIDLPPGTKTLFNVTIMFFEPGEGCYPSESIPPPPPTTGPMVE